MDHVLTETVAAPSPIPRRRRASSRTLMDGARLEEHHPEHRRTAHTPEVLARFAHAHGTNPAAWSGIKFQQGASSSTRTKGGTGLDRCIAKRILEMHGRRMQVESSVGKGPIFSFALPVLAERQPEA